jgi:hypothetical protein
MFHNPRERCPHNPCLLGHDEARKALKALKAFGRCERLAKQQESLLSIKVQKFTTETPPVQNHNILTAAAQTFKEAPQSSSAKPNPKPQTEKETDTQGKNQINPPVSFEMLVKENKETGQLDEMRRIYLLTNSVKSDFDAFKKRAEETEKAKDQEVRSLQEAMGEMVSENAHLKAENKSKLSVIDLYYRDVFEGSSSTRSLLNLEKTPPSETAVEGTLVVFKTMYAKSVEFQGASREIDMFLQRPVTRFSDQVPTLQSLGLTKDNAQHAFFLKCYIRFPTDPSFCLNGVMDTASSVVSISPGGAFPPKAWILKKTPKRFRRAFFAQSASQTVTDIANASLSLKKGGGLSVNEPLPSEVHNMLGNFCHGEFFKNPSVPFAPQIVSYIQNAS